MQCRVLLVHLIQNDAERAVRYRKRDDADDHDGGAEPALRRVGRRDVAVSDGGDRRDRPVKGNGVQVASCVVAIVVRLHPSVFQVLIVKLRENDEEAGQGVTEDEEDAYEEEKSVETGAEVQRIVQQLQEPIPFLQDLEHPNQSQQLHQLVQTADSGKSNESIHIR